MKKKLLFLVTAVLSFSSQAQKTPIKKEDNKDPLANASTFNALKFRSIGPAVVSGRIIDIAVNPKKKTQWVIAAASGGVWKTDNAGVTFNPLFDSQASFSIGCVTIDPNNTNVIWVGTGENNNQRSVAYGDGIYKSEDGGKSWNNMGLKNSEHIGKISIDPTNSDIVYVAAYGPLWAAGGDRGIYKSTDGGKTWKQILTVSENTGFNEVHIDPNHPNIIYATAHQRRRHEWTYVSGGPESAIYKSNDGGATWNKLTNGLPKEDMGRIGLAISPANTDLIYAIIEGSEEEKGVYRSQDRGASWEKQSNWATAGNYYQEIFADPKNADKLFSMDTWAQVSLDGGKTFKGLGEKNKHVDNHALYIDSDNTEHMIMGCDGGIYETWDGAKNWDFKANLPITQFYRVSVDNSKPFYYVYAGTQDNATLGGPSRTTSASGILNSDWFVTVGGDGFESAIDPQNPDIVYSQWQYGGLVRYDRKSGEALDIKPQEKEGEAAYRWNWDAPLLISQFNNSRIYFAANKVFRSDDRGNSWKVISGDLSRGIDRNKLPLMGKVWGMDAIAKNSSTSIYGNITALTESPKKENLLIAGTDDGLIHITENNGNNWKKIETFPGIPERSLVQNITCSQHDENLIYAAFNNQRNGDFKPYILKSTDKGKSWVNIASNLPNRGTVYSIAEDHVISNLLFAGTEFGMFFTINGGTSWTQLNSGLPTICIKDIAIQKRENDLVLATFGRGIYILDDYSVLQNLKKEDMEKGARIFPIKDALLFIESTPLGDKGKSSQGASFYTADNPPLGANITYWIKDDCKTIKESRKEREKEKVKNNLPLYYPSADSIRIEDLEEAAYLILLIIDENGNVVRKMKQPAKKGLHRVNWNGRHDVTSPVSFRIPNPDNPYDEADKGPLALPGKYWAQLVKVADGKVDTLTERTSLELITLNNSTLPVNKKELDTFNKDLAEFRRVVLATNQYCREAQERIKYIKAAVLQMNTVSADIISETKESESLLQGIELALNGDRSLAKREFETLPGLIGKIEGIVGNLWSTSAQQTTTYVERLNQSKISFRKIHNDAKQLKSKIESLENKLESRKAPYTPGRFPEF
jgi:photosystem II stability/assembly factor-like uncharacterized protein